MTQQLKYVGNSHTMVVHLIGGCEPSEEIRPEREELFAEWYDAAGAGYRECRYCFGWEYAGLSHVRHAP